MAGGAKAYRQTAVTIPEHAIDRDAPTLRPPARPNALHEHALLARFRALSPTDREFVFALIERLLSGGRRDDA